MTPHTFQRFTIFHGGRRIAHVQPMLTFAAMNDRPAVAAEVGLRASGQRREPRPLADAVSFPRLTEPRARNSTMTSPSVALHDVGTAPAPLRKDLAPFSQLLEIARELLGTLKHATRAGQAHVMQRVLRLLHREILCPNLRLTEQQLGTVMTAVTDLEHESVRVAPDVAIFNARAQIVVDVLCSYCTAGAR